MAQKRPCDDEVVNEASSKHPRQDGPVADIISHKDDCSEEADNVNLQDSGEINIGKDEDMYHQECENDNSREVRLEDVVKSDGDAHKSASLSHWAGAGASDEDEPPEEMVHTPFYSGYFSFDRPVRPAINPDDIYHCLLDYPPRKQIPVGPEYQAEIPPLGENASKVNHGADGVYLETYPVAHVVLKVGDGRIDCKCPDRGSVRCVRLHIAEVREKLTRVLGHDTFMELGFNDMGEVVADKWANEEERLFHEVVYSNPVSLGKNFWNVLSAVFPSRTKMEIVSYYFNVFMLRKRAEQNRCDRMNIDSDNDEWQGSDSDRGDGGLSDDDDDSGIESPTHHDGLSFNQNELSIPKHEEDDGDISDDTRKTNANSSFESTEKKSDDGGDNDAQDGSCTSSDSGASTQETQIKSDASHDWHEYILGSTDAKAWDGYISCPKNNVDFLPTCSMIEEVFGGDFDSKDKRR